MHKALEIALVEKNVLRHVISFIFLNCYKLTNGL